VTKQDKILARLGPVKIRTGGWFIKKETIKRLTSSESLRNFLNVDTANEHEVDKYCVETGYHPLDITQGWAEGFRTEQISVKEMADKIVQGRVGNEEIEEIAQRLRNVVMRAKVLNETELEKLNEDLYRLKKSEDYYKILDEGGSDKYLVYVAEYLTSIDEMWGCIYSTLKTNRPLKKCRDVFRCARFFIPKLQTPNQKFCTLECENRYNHRVSYKKKARRVGIIS